ncbi:NAD(P)H-binding protein [Microlunatus soli]|uniref:Uncharacterized conserved protein YbjT, contains NAD(P)-binding and DUF2867 domains n=1 Tax=Microlunatus soli TaxID=630515 RepID=A0A1H1YB58_9ACTN|nr:NAD(P)H-binding protein [Microlunatus soli]SDT18499.1 Uncharacterized conserved protein YbjT, contains NAD(P)-binding and DUF2867 domains [Microlunatus soli]
MTTTTVLVLGGTGKTGRRIADRLDRRNDVTVRIGSRSAPVPFDWTDAGTWAAALAGVDAVYLSYQPDLAVPGAERVIGDFCDLAVAAGVRRIVLLSGRGENEAEACERIVQQTGLQTTVLRCSWFDQNFSEDYMIDGILDGELVLPVGDVPDPFIDAEDIADVATAALLDGRHAGQVYELTGPRSISFADAVKEISRATGREITFSTVAVDAYLAALRDQQVPTEVVDLLGYLFRTVLDGRNSEVADGVQRALGREPADFADFAERTAAADGWQQRS